MFRQVKTEFWTDPRVRSLDSGRKLHFIYLITNPQTHLSGIYSLPVVLQAYQMGLTEQQVVESLSTLEKAGLIEWDAELEIVWVRRMLAHQAARGEKIAQAVARQLTGLHQCKLIPRFLREYKAFEIPYR